MIFCSLPFVRALVLWSGGVWIFVRLFLLFSALGCLLPQIFLPFFCRSPFACRSALLCSSLFLSSAPSAWGFSLFLLRFPLSSEIPPLVQVPHLTPPSPHSDSIFPPPLSSSLPFSRSSSLPSLPTNAPFVVPFRLFAVISISHCFFV